MQHPRRTSPWRLPPGGPRVRRVTP
jgi:hypothetical protein